MADKELLPPSIRIDREQFGRAWPVMSGDEVGGVEYIRADLCAQPTALASLTDQRNQALDQCAELHAALAAQRAQMVGEVERMRDEWTKGEEAHYKAHGNCASMDVLLSQVVTANKILRHLRSLQPTEKQESEPLEEKQ